MAFGESAQQHWYEDRASPWWTLPLAGLYGSVTTLRRALYRRGWLKAVRLPVPVIVIGNISVGGTGKTPLVIALVEALCTRGFSPGVVSRGYGGTARLPMLLDAQSDPVVVGDEPVLIRIRTGVPVAVGVDRPDAARLLIDEGANVIIADDGLQHYALARDLEICVVDGMRRFGNGRLLPAGPLREPLSRLRSVDFTVCNGGEPQANEVPMRLELGDAISLAEPLRRTPLPDFSGAAVHAVAGIGNPARFFESLRAFGIEPVEHPFPDHHRYAAVDLDFGDSLPVLMTEKDAVKCRDFAGPGRWYVPVAARLPDSFFEGVAMRIKQP